MAEKMAQIELAKRMLALHSLVVAVGKKFELKYKNLNEKNFFLLKFLFS